MEKSIFLSLLVLLVINFSCQDQEVKLEANIMEQTQYEINQFMLNSGFVNFNKANSNSRVSSVDNQEIKNGILSILEKNGGIKITDQNMIDNFNSIIEVYEGINIINENARTMCTWNCHASVFNMGDDIYVVVTDCSNGCGSYTLANSWFKGSTYLGVNRWD